MVYLTRASSFNAALHHAMVDAFHMKAMDKYEPPSLFESASAVAIALQVVIALKAEAKAGTQYLSELDM